MTTVQDIFQFLDGIAPFQNQASWDNSGLLIGSAAACVTKVVVALDITREEIDLAVNCGAELIISHHPVLFHPVKNLTADSVLYKAARNGLNAICTHTNLDKAPGGVNDALCDALGMTYRKMPETLGEGFVNIGSVDGIHDAVGLASYISEKLGASVRYVDCGKDITLIGVCSGAGGDLTAEAAGCGCTAFITGDASYHDFLDALSAGISLFAAGHFETENLITDNLVKRLTAAFPGVSFLASSRKAPIKTLN